MFSSFAMLAASAAGEPGFFSSWASGLNLGAIILLLLGVILIVIEMLIPGFGIAGISGGAACIAGLIIGSDTFEAALFTFGIIVVVLLLSAVVIFKFVFGKSKKPSKIVLSEAISRDEIDNAEARSELIGKSGIALTPLRPSGIAMVDGKRLDVLASGEFVAKGESVTVVSIEGIKINVEKTEK